MKVRMPEKDEKCEKNHYFVHENGELTDHVAFDKKGEPFCETCDDVEKVLHYSSLPQGKDGKPELECPRGHKATKNNQAMVADVKDGQVVGIHFICKDCEKKVKKALPRRVETPGGETIRSRGGRYDLSAATANSLDDGSFKLTAVHKPTGEVRDLTDTLPGRSEESYKTRSRDLGRLYEQALHLPTLLDQTNQVPNHGILDGQEVGVDHVVPLRGGGFHHELNAVLKPHSTNRAIQDKMPTVADIEQMGPAYSHLIPYVRALNPTNSTNFYAKTGPTSSNLPTREYTNNELGVGGPEGSGIHTRGKFTHYTIPGFNQHKTPEFNSEGVRHSNVASWLDAIQKTYGDIPNFDTKTDPVFNIQQRKDGKGQIEFLNPQIRKHIINGMQQEYDDAGHAPEVKNLFRQQARLLLSQRHRILIRL